MWSIWVRNTLQWLGCADPCDSMERLYEGDPARESHEAMIVTWRDQLGIRSEFHAQQLIERSILNQDLRTALLAVAQEANTNGIISAKRLGRWLKKVHGKICQGPVHHAIQNIRGIYDVEARERLGKSVGDGESGGIKSVVFVQVAAEGRWV
jgi:hypothetical protein